MGKPLIVKRRRVYVAAVKQPDGSLSWRATTYRPRSRALVDYITSSSHKSSVVRAAAAFCRAMHEQTGAPWQLRILDRNGCYQSERTYGRDPRRSRG